jgi:predicted nucleotidyltransferase
MTDLSRALTELVELFDRLQLRYAVMGGIAVRVYGIPRPTHDVDFTVAIDRGRLPELYREVMRLGYTVPEEFTTGWVDQVAGLPLIRFRLYNQGYSIDIDIFLAESDFQRQMLARRQCVAVGSQPVWMVSAEDLILLKLVAARPRDLSDIADILFTQGAPDHEYLRRWARELDVLEKLEQVLAEANNSTP